MAVLRGYSPAPSAESYLDLFEKHVVLKSKQTNKRQLLPAMYHHSLSATTTQQCIVMFRFVLNKKVVISMV